MKTNIKLVLLTVGVVLFTQGFFAQNSKQKVYFDKSGKNCSESIANYYRQQSDTADYYRSYYISNGKLYFAGKIKVASSEDESKNQYAGQCIWYYKNGTQKQVRRFTESGLETGLSIYYYESGKVQKEIDFENGKTKNSWFVEYDEDGTKNKIFVDDFNNNANEWDLYLSDKSTSTINNGMLELIAASREGTSRFINYAVESGEFTIEAVLSLADIKDDDRVGIIYGFKDWQNYHYFAISKHEVFIGSFYEGVKSTELDGMFCSSIAPLQNNVLKILSGREKMYFSINGEIQYKDDSNRLYGNNFGFVLSGGSKLKVDRLTIKEVNFSSKGNYQTSPSDKEVKATGSGIMFSTSGYILTNFHVIDNATKFIVEVNDGTSQNSYAAEVITQDKENDLAIIKINDEQFKPLKEINYSFKESGSIDVGASVFTIGYPYALSGMGKEAKFTDGKISSKNGYNGGINSFQTSIPVQPGNSGGPVFNNSGQLIGVINASLREADNVSYAIKLNYIKNLIESMNEKVEPPSKNTLGELSTEEKVKILTKYVVLIKIK